MKIPGSVYRHLRKKKILRQTDSILSKAARFIACEQVEGDYLEFGVYRGEAFIQSYFWLQQQFKSRIRLETGGSDESHCRANRERIWNEMRFFAFDSYEGLPELSEFDKESVDFKQGQYAATEAEFLSNTSRMGVPVERTICVKGFFSDICNAETRENLHLKKAALVWLDADLYSSTIDALNFITPTLQDGTVLVFDDWFSFRGHPEKGVQKAFHEWESSLLSQYKFVEYQRDSWKRMSFICSKK